MSFNKRRMESERAAAAKEAEARRTLGRQVIEDAERLVEAWNARQAAHAGAVLADHRRRHRRVLLVPMAALPGLPQ